MPPPDEQEQEAAHIAEGRRLTDEIKRRIAPQLQEMGVTGFLLAGYIETGDGKKARLMMVCDNDDPAIGDGLRPLAAYAAVWGNLVKPHGHLPSS